MIDVGGPKRMSTWPGLMLPMFRDRCRQMKAKCQRGALAVYLPVKFWLPSHCNAISNRNEPATGRKNPVCQIQLFRSMGVSVEAWESAFEIPHAMMKQAEVVWPACNSELLKLLQGAVDETVYRCVQSIPVYSGKYRKSHFSFV
jgi:hypothetical protein